MLMINDLDMCIFMNEKILIGLKQEEHKCKWYFTKCYVLSWYKTAIKNNDLDSKPNTDIYQTTLKQDDSITSTSITNKEFFIDEEDIIMSISNQVMMLVLISMIF